MKKNILYILLIVQAALFAGCNDEQIIEVPGQTEVVVTGGSDDVTFTPEQLALPKKKGACFTLRTSGEVIDYISNMKKVEALNPGWNYSWGNTIVVNQPDNLEFVPMFWGGCKAEDVKYVIEQVKAGKVKRVLGFNEPDSEEQSNMTVDEAVSQWPLLQSFKVPLGSPAVVGQDKDAWLEEFMGKVDELGYRVDFICVHSYGGTNAEAFKQNLKNTYDKYKRPILVTEFAVADWEAEKVNENRHKEENVIAFMKEVLPWMEDQGFILGYSWFSFSQTDPHGTTSALFDKNGYLTKLGRIYAAYPDEPESEPEDKNLLKDGDLENGQGAWSKATHNGNTGPWTNVSYPTKTYDANNIVISGERSMKLQSAKYVDNTQEIELEGGKRYKFGFKYTAANVQGGDMKIISLDEALVVYAELSTKITGTEGTPDNPKSVSQVFEMPGEGKVKVKVQVLKLNTDVASTLVLDDIFVEETTEPVTPEPDPEPQPGDNLVKNGDFESGKLDNWIVSPEGLSGKVTLLSEGALSGSYSVKINAKEWVAVTQTIHLEKGKTYECSVNYSTDAGGVMAIIQANQSNKIHTMKLETVNTSPSSTFTYNGETGDFQLVISKNKNTGTGANYLILDDISIKEVTVAP